jgi:hypothetical protein
MSLTFDAVNHVIVLDSTSTSATAIYSAWVDWVSTSDYLKYLPAFTTVGGDPLGNSLVIPPYYFLINDWKVRPMEADQVLTITGNLFVTGTGNAVIPTLGSFNVLVNMIVPVLAMGINVQQNPNISGLTWQNSNTIETVVVTGS